MKTTTIKGIEFVLDENGQQQAVVIDLAEWGELWEDFYDVMVAHSRQKEEDVAWEALKQVKTDDLSQTANDCHPDPKPQNQPE